MPKSTFSGVIFDFLPSLALTYIVNIDMCYAPDGALLDRICLDARTI